MNSVFLDVFDGLYAFALLGASNASGQAGREGERQRGRGREAAKQAGNEWLQILVVSTNIRDKYNYQ